MELPIWGLILLASVDGVLGKIAENNSFDRG